MRSICAALSVASSPTISTGTVARSASMAASVRRCPKRTRTSPPAVRTAVIGTRTPRSLMLAMKSLSSRASVRMLTSTSRLRGSSSTRLTGEGVVVGAMAGVVTLRCSLCRSAGAPARLEDPPGELRTASAHRRQRIRATRCGARARRWRFVRDGPGRQGRRRPEQVSTSAWRIPSPAYSGSERSPSRGSP